MLGRLLIPIKQFNLKILKSSSKMISSLAFQQQEIIQKRKLATTDVTTKEPFKSNVPFEKIKRLEYSSPVVLGFLPYEWFEYFFKKTGVTGFATFLTTVSLSLFSKEIYVCEHEFYNGLSMLLVCVIFVKLIGPGLAKYLDDEIDAYAKSNSDVQENERNNRKYLIEFEKKEQLSQEGQLLLVVAKRENVLLQLEAEYRERLMSIYRETKKRLEYCVVREEVERAMAQRNMSTWVVKEVKSSITQEIQEKALSQCLQDLKDLAKFYESKKIFDKKHKK